MIPIRMCIVCKKRFEQRNLIRLQCKNKKLLSYTGEGRSFYICKICIDKDHQIAKSLKRYCKSDKNSILKTLKEYKEKIVNG